jgi:hypothetical protein
MNVNDKDNTINEINISFIYINKLNEIEDISRENYKLNKINFISKEELTSILKDYISLHSDNIKTYTITSILKYNINIYSEEETKKYLSDNYQMDEIPFLTIIKEISDIYFQPSLDIFKELNELFIIFYENIEIKYFNKKTKRIYLKNIKNNSRKKI